jgi:dihydroxyacid dehydratase/phosphogluconate dehydratase
MRQDVSERAEYHNADRLSTPALLMAAATANIPAIVYNVGPMLNGS